MDYIRDYIELSQEFPFSLSWFMREDLYSNECPIFKCSLHKYSLLIVILKFSDAGVYS